MATLTASQYRRPLLDPNDRLFVRCLFGSALVAALLVAVVRLVPLPAPRPVTHVEELPQRFAKLILEPHKPIPPPVPPAADNVHTGIQNPGGGGSGQADPADKPLPAPGLPAGNRHIEAMHAIADGFGAAGRGRAQAEVGAQLASTSASLQRALAGLDASLGITSSAPGGSVSRGGRAHGIREARSAGELGAELGAGSARLGGGAAGAHGDLGGSVVNGSLVSIGDLAAGPGWGTGSGSGAGSGSLSGGGSGTGSGDGSGYGPGSPGGSEGGAGGGAGGDRGERPGVYRSNASLLAVIQRYAAGIQYCYGNELKRDPSTRGRLVVAITVAASGEVAHAAVVQNTTGSSLLASCALSQIRDWRFPAIPTGLTTFQAPFVFTPPN